MAYTEVYYFKQTYTVSGSRWLDYLGNAEIQNPFTPKQIPQGNISYPGFALPDLRWVGGGTTIYEEIWEAELVLKPGGWSTTSEGPTSVNPNFESGHSFNFGTPVLGPEGIIHSRVVPFRVTVNVTTPTGTYNYVYVHSNINLVPLIPATGTLTGGDSWVSRAPGGVPVPQTPFTWLAHSTVLTIEKRHWGQEPAIPDNSYKAYGSTPGRSVKLAVGSCWSESHMSTGDPYAGGSGHDLVQITWGGSWIDAWQLRFRFDLVNHLGAPVSKRVIFAKGTRRNVASGSLDHFEVKTGSFDETISHPTQMITNDGSVVEASGSSTLDWAKDPNVIKPYGIGVIIPKSTYEGEAPPADALNIQWNDTERIQRPWGGFLTYQPKPGWVPVRQIQAFDADNYTLSLPASSLMDRQPSGWTPSGAGGSVAGNTLTATMGTIRFSATIPSPHTTFWIMYPYRWYCFDYTAESDGEVDVILGQPTPGGLLEKLYTISVQAGSHKAYVDTCNPQMVRTGGGGFSAASTLPRIDGANVILANPLRYSDGRFGGIVTQSSLGLQFADNEITVTNFGAEVRYRAKGRKMPPLFSYDPFVLSEALSFENLEINPFYVYIGDVDGKDAHRYQLVPAVNAPTSLPHSGSTFNYDWSVARYSQNTLGHHHAAATQRDGSLWPEVDFVTGFTDNDSTYNYGCGTYPNMHYTGLAGGVPLFHASMFWGQSISATTIRQTSAELENQTVDDGASFTEDVDVSTPSSTKGWGLKPMTWWWSPNAVALNWTGEDPNDGNRHFRLRDRTQIGTPDWRTRDGALSVGTVYWVGLLGVPGARTISYDVTNSLRHAVAYLDNDDDTVVVALSDHKPYPWTPVHRDSGIVATNCWIRWNKQSREQTLHLWTVESGEVKMRTSLDEAKTWSMPRTVASGTFDSVAAVIGDNELVYTYMLEVGAIKGKIEDIKTETVKALFTVVGGGVDTAGIAADEGWDEKGKHFIAIWYFVGGNLQVIKSYDGCTNWS